MNDRNTTEVICEHCEHKNILSDLAGWTYIIMKYTVCKECKKETK